MTNAQRPSSEVLRPSRMVLNKVGLYEAVCVFEAFHLYDNNGFTPG